MTGHLQRLHRRFSPSQSERFIACHGAHNLLARVPVRPSSKYAIEGTKAHDILEAGLANGVRRAQEAHKDHSDLCMESLNTFQNQFYYSIQVALNHIYDILDEYSDAVLFTEVYVDPPIDSAPGEAGGYCDVAIFVPSKRLLFVMDYKHGAGVCKAVKGNTQIMQYACGFLFDPNSPIDPEQVDEVVLTIIQPRAFHEDGMIREHVMTSYELYEHLQELDEIIASNLKPDAPLTPGTDQCRFCDANTLCPAREAKALDAAGAHFETIEQVKKPDLPVPLAMDYERLAYIRLHAPMLRKWLDDVDKHCKGLMMQGHAMPGAKLVEVKPRRQWYGDEDELAKKIASLAAVPEEDVMQRKLIGIVAAEKLIVEAFKKRVSRNRRKQAAEDAKQAFAFLTLKQSSGNLTVVDEDDKRPAVNRAVENFNQIPALPYKGE